VIFGSIKREFSPLIYRESAPDRTPHRQCET
jgi:hypothetical protein